MTITWFDRATRVRRALVELVAEHGLHGAGMSAVAKRAGVGTRRLGASFRRRQLMVGLSIGFRTGTKPVWEPPPTKGMPPVRRVRGAEIVEVSIVNYPAYESAATLSLNQRSYYDEELHRQSEEAIAWVAARKDKKHRELDEIIAWVAARKSKMLKGSN